MHKNLDNLSEFHRLTCPSCESNNLSVKTVSEEFQYGSNDIAVTLTALIHVHHCSSCDLSFTTEEASETRHEAVCRYLGVLTPAEIRGIRNQNYLSQSGFSELTKIGKASLARWETGAIIQNQANDNLLYLLSFPNNISRLKERACLRNTCSDQSTPNIMPFLRKFRAIPDDQMSRLQAEADRFELFPAATVT